MGIEKLIPDYPSLGVFTRLLARSATGQPVTTYTSHYRKPRRNSEMHIVLVDNGRTTSMADGEDYSMLKCLRCGACINTCPVYRRSGGYSYRHFIPGPIGINLGMLADAVHNADMLSACSLCLSCEQVCPAKIDLGRQIYRRRQTLVLFGRQNKVKQMLSRSLQYVFSHPRFYNRLLRLAPIVNKLPRFLVYNRLNTWGEGRELPLFAPESFTNLWRKGKVQGQTNQKQDDE
jgi:L-lactate dehydrogenase complex protein LldF